MSIILSVATREFAIIMGDGRITDDLTGNIVKEDYNKVYNVNNEISIGYAGNILSCEETLNGLNIHMSYSTLLDYLYNNARCVYQKYRKEMIICIVGIADNRNFAINYFSSSDFKIHTHIPAENVYVYTSLIPYMDSKIFENILRESACITIDDFLLAIKKAVYKVSEITPLVNNNLTGKIIHYKTR